MYPVLLYFFSAVHSMRCSRYLPSSPYEDSPTLHIYAGLISLYLAQPTSDSMYPSHQYARSLDADHFAGRTSWDHAALRGAKQYLERAKTLNSEDVVASAWLDKVNITDNCRITYVNDYSRSQVSHSIQDAAVLIQKMKLKKTPVWILIRVPNAYEHD